MGKEKGTSEKLIKGIRMGNNIPHSIQRNMNEHLRQRVIGNLVGK